MLIIIAINPINLYINLETVDTILIFNCSTHEHENMKHFVNLYISLVQCHASPSIVI